MLPAVALTLHLHVAALALLMIMSSQISARATRETKCTVKFTIECLFRASRPNTYGVGLTPRATPLRSLLRCASVTSLFTPRPRLVNSFLLQLLQHKSTVLLELPVGLKSAWQLFTLSRGSPTLTCA